MAKWPYNTAQWQRLRRLKLSMTPLCEYCPPGRLTLATTVDHKVSIANGGDPWDRDNLASCCERCHNSKTAADKTGKEWQRKGCDEQGRPFDPNHWWNK
jgi:5-methylcytosine-specific restriction protein A